MSMDTYKKSDITDKLYLLEPIDFIPYFEDIAGQWDGENPGRLEDQAHIAKDIIELLQELQEA